MITAISFNMARKLESRLLDMSWPSFYQEDMEIVPWQVKSWSLLLVLLRAFSSWQQFCWTRMA